MEKIKIYKKVTFSGNKLSSLLIFAFILLVLFSGCKNIIAIDSPITSINSQNVFASDETATSAIAGIYTSLNNTGFQPGIAALNFFPGLSADEFTLFSGVMDQSYIQYYRNNINVNTNPVNFWGKFYQYIFSTNLAIEGLTNSVTLTPSVKSHLLGEAKFIRAFAYFNLVNLYGDVLLTLTSNYKNNMQLPRTVSTQVYDQIITDLIEARNDLSADYVDGSSNHPTESRTRVNKATATALLAKVYLYVGKYNLADIEASKVIDDSRFELVPIEGVFKKESREAIWQLQPVTPGANSADAPIFYLPETGPNGVENPVYQSARLVDAFESHDKRLASWIGLRSLDILGTTYNFHFAKKYNVFQVNAPVIEYQMIFRLAEQYLIWAEARANGSSTGLPGAISDLNVIRVRAGLTGLTGLNEKTSILNAIYQERRVELFTEGANRWFDLQRSGQIETVMIPASKEKGGTWSDFDKLYPIPASELLLNNNLIQNPGY